MWNTWLYQYKNFDANLAPTQRQHMIKRQRFLFQAQEHIEIREVTEQRKRHIGGGGRGGSRTEN